MAASTHTANMIDAKVTADPVADVIQTFSRAAKVANRYRDIEFAQHLALSLEHSQNHIEKSFNNGLEKHGNLQLEALLDDDSFTTELKGVKLSLLEVVETLRDYGDDPDDYDESIFLKLQQDSEAARNKALIILQRLSQSLPHLTSPPLSARNSQVSIEKRRNPRAISQPPTQKLPPTPIQRKDSTGRNFQELPHSPPPSDGFRSPILENDIELMVQEQYMSEGSHTDEQGFRLSIAQSETSLSDTGFSHDDKNGKTSSWNSPIINTRESEGSMRAQIGISIPASKFHAQNLSHSPNGVDSAPSPVLASPISLSSLPERPFRTRMSSLRGRNPEQNADSPFPLPLRTSSSNRARSSSNGPVSPELSYYFSQSVAGERQSIASNPRSPLTPSALLLNKSHRQSTNSEELNNGPWETERLRHSNNSLPSTPEIPHKEDQASLQRHDSTLALPDHANGIPEGIEVGKPKVEESIERIVPDGLILANEDKNGYSPPDFDYESVGQAINTDSSFFQMGGWCEGARILQNGTKGSFRVISTPTGPYTSTKSARCSKCSYEIPFSTIELDLLNDKAGIFKHHQIRWRTRFLQKSHLRAKSVEEGIYACPFCVQEGRTIDGWDATVFFSPNQFLKHLDKHNNRKREPIKMNVLTGPSWIDAVNADVEFDIAFLDEPDEEVSPYVKDKEIISKLSTHPSGLALQAHYPRMKNFKARDPEGNFALRFAEGARIEGITYPFQFNGQWCRGYHDGVQGLFPSSLIRLHEPLCDDTLGQQTALTAVAHWDHKIKGSQHRWLSFPKGANLTNVSFPREDHWCWAGEYKGKSGLFPASFVQLTNGRLDPRPVLNRNNPSSAASIKTNTGKSIFRGFSKRRNSTSSTAGSSRS